jgi:hypothetical protein
MRYEIEFRNKLGFGPQPDYHLEMDKAEQASCAICWRCGFHT